MPVRDLIFVCYLGLIALLAFKRPFLYTLIYAYIDIVAPQRLSYFMLNSIPISLMMFGCALAGYMVYDNKTDTRITLRHFTIVLLLIYCGYTTAVADEPWAAAEKWSWVWKALVFAAFLPLVLKTRLRIEALTMLLVLAVSTLVVTGGIKTAGGGSGYGQLVLLIYENSGLFESSTISCVAIMIIPLILWLRKYGTIFKRDWRVNLYATALICACLLIPVGTQARTGLICASVLAVLLLLKLITYNIRYIFLPLIGGPVLILAAIPFLPQTFLDRMDTIRNYQADQSASTRIAVWKWTIEYAEENPLGGGFEAYRQNKIRYEVDEKDENGDTGPRAGEFQVDEEGRAYHSSYFEMLGEQGYAGLLMWLFIHVGGVWRMQSIRRLYKKRNRPDEEWVGPLASALRNSQIIFLFGSFFVGIAFQPFVYMLTALQIGLDTYLARRRAEAAWKPISHKEATSHKLLSFDEIHVKNRAA